MNYVESLDLLGSEVKQIPNITGAGAPTTATEGAVGCLYMDTTTGDMYKCTAASDGVYTWVDGLAGKLDKTDESWRLYGTAEAGVQKLYYMTDKGTAGYVATYGYENVGEKFYGGYLPSGDPTKPYQCANKKYVDEKLSEVGGGSIELAESLSGNDTDKAPSVKAVNEGLAGKVDATSTLMLLYGTDIDGNQTQIPYGNNVQSARIVQRLHSGNINVPLEPSADAHATSKKYVDGEIDKVREEVGGTGIEMVVQECGYDFGDGWMVPEGALLNFHVLSTEFTYSWTNYDTDESGVATGNFYNLYFIDEDGNYTGPEPVQSHSYCTMPQGTRQIVSDLNDMLNNDTLNPGYDLSMRIQLAPLIFQVEV